MGLLRKSMARGVSRQNGAGMPPSITVYVFVFLVLLSGFLLAASGSLLDVKNTGLSLFSGIRGGIHELTLFVSRTVLSVKELSVMRREHAELLRLLERYQELERTSAEIYQENIRLREQLRFEQTLRYRRIPAQISGRDPGNLYSAVVINKIGRAHV